jgi:hypothetical protein
VIDLAAVRCYEIDFCARFADVERREWGLLYACRDNPISYDSNHAVILDPLSMDDAAKGPPQDQIEAIYPA